MPLKSGIASRQTRSSFAGECLRVLLCHPGTQYAGRLGAELHRRGILWRYWTGIAWPQQILPWKTVWEGQQWLRVGFFRMVDVPLFRLRLTPVIECRCLWRLRFDRAEMELILHDRNERFQRRIPKNEIERVEVVIGYDTSSWILARRVKDQGRRFILDRSIGHSREKELCYEALRKQFPAWRNSITIKAESHLIEEDMEHALADVIVVPSRFVAQTVEKHGVARDKIRIIPFGTDLERFFPSEEPASMNPLRFLFVGGVSARKGIPLLLQAWRNLQPRRAELWIVGPGNLPVEEIRAGVPDTIKFFGKKSPAEVAAIMRSCHVFVFPSFFEGLAQVQIEAAACGLPVIGTNSSGAEEILESGKTGMIIQSGDLSALTDAIAQFLNRSNLAIEMRQHTLERRSQLSWDTYGEKWNKLIAGMPITYIPSE